MERLYPCQDKTNGFIKKLWLLATFLVFALQANAQFVGCGEFHNLTFSTQYDMNQFALNYPDCTQVPGNLRIEGSGVTDLTPLSQLTSVGGGIYIGNTNLTDLDGLHNITNVEHDVRIRNNPSLIDISGLSGLNSDFLAWTGYGLEITNNSQLSTCNLPNFCSYLLNSSNFRTIQNNAGACATNAAMVQLCTPVTVCPSGSITLASQAAVNAFAANYPNCIQITGSVKIEGDDITDLAPLSNIITITEGLTIRTKNLTSLNGLHNLQKIGKYLYVYETELLTTLNGLAALTEVRGEVIIRTNLALNDISALSNIDSSLIRTVPIAADSYGINIFGNPQLATCNIPNFCSYLSNPTNSRNISNNTGNCTSAILTYACIPEITTCPMTDLVFNSQADLDAYGQFYPACMEIYHSVTISGAVTDLSSLHTIQAIRGNLTISGTSVLTDLDNLSNLTAVYGTISIHNNLDLEDISGLSGIRTISNLNGGLTITNNPALTICEVPNICMYLVNLSNPRNVENNSGNCNTATIGNSCMPVLPTCPVSGLVFNTQAQVDAFGLYYPNCTVIPDSVIISGASITDLSPLGNIQTIQGELSISGTSGLTNLNDLSSLTSVLGLVSISSNIGLQDISGLSGIMSFNGLTITNNPALTICEVPNICMYVVNPANPRNIGNNSGNCNNATIGNSCIPVLPTCPVSSLSFSTQAQVDAYGLYYPNCTEISGSLSIFGGTITDLSPLNTIQTINGPLNIFSTSFTNLNSFGNLTSVKNLAIRHNSQLQDISGLSNVLELSASNSTGLIIEYNPLLATCSIPSICAYTSNVNNPRTINNNAGGCANSGALGLACEALLPSCPESTSIGFASQQQLDNFALNYPNCTNFPGDIYIYADLDLTPLQNLQTIGGNFGIMYNIHDLDGLNALTSIGGSLTIQDSNQLQNLNALQNLTSIGGSLIIKNIPLLVNFDHLESLTHIGAGIRLESNAALVDISALSQLNTMVPPNWGMLRILNNPLLATCNVPYICSYLLNPNASYLILGNAGDCASQYSVVTACNSTSCATPSNLTASNITINQAEITWDNGDNFKNFTIEFGPSGFTIGTGTTVSGITANSYLASGLQMGTVYDVYLKKDCGYNDSTALMTTFNTVGYCIPSATHTSSVSEGIYIKNFTTTGAITNISNIDSGYSANGYGNFSGSHSASHYPGQSINFEAVGGNGTGTRGLKIWIDWDNSIAFEEASELVFSSAALQSGTHSGSFQIPANTASGNYRMRLFLQENTLPADPCNTTAQATAFGELEDYTLTVLELSPCNLDTVTATSIISDSATLNWTSPGSLFEMEWGPAGFTQGAGTQQNGITTASYTLQGLTEQTAYDVYVRSICAYNQSSWVKHTFSTRSVCPSGDIIFNTQEKINDFATNYPYCTELSGNVGFSNNITDLAPLNNIVSISGNLSLTFVPTLTSLNGLTSLTSVGGEIYIYQTKFPDLNSLSSLTTPGHTIWISGNSLLNNISGLKNINLSEGTLTTLVISDNPNLAICNYDFMCSYFAGSGYKYIANNATGCENQTVIATFCATCDAPTNITHLSVSSACTINWTSSGNSFDIEWGTAGFKENSLPSLETQNSVAAFNYTMTGLSASTSYDVYIRRNCTNIQSIWVKYTFSTLSVCPSGPVVLLSQADVDNFGATYPNCTEIEQNVYISGYPNGVTDISPLQHIVSIGGELEFNSTNLVNLDALSNLTHVGGRIRIISNYHLVDISGLSNITPYELSIVSNPSLATCNLENFCTFLSGNGFRNIQGNKADCFTEQTVLATCEPMVPQNCEGDVVLDSQMAVDAFGINNQDCTHISGNLTIFGIGITNLSPLNNITSVGGNLMIRNTRLYNLTGLGAVNTIGGELMFESNTYLQDVTALSSLNSVGGFSIYQNPLLGSITAFESITSVSGTLAISENNSLASLQGLHNITNVGEYLMVVDNNLLTNLDPLSNVASVGKALYVSGNPSLTTIDGLSAITSVGDGIVIRNNDALQNLNGLSQVVNFAGTIDITENTQLNDISALENIDYTSISDLRIIGNAQLSVCNLENLCSYFADFSKPRTVAENAIGCENMNVIYAACSIVPPTCPLEPIEFASQADIDNYALLYPECTALPFPLFVQGNNVADFSAFSNLVSIAGPLYIIETGLQNLDSLSQLTSINGDIIIANNSSLTSIAGLQGIDPESIIYDYQGLFIVNNPLLSVCSLENLCLYLTNYDNLRTISGNAEGCGEQELNALCGIVCPPPGDISFRSQEEIDAFGAMYPNCTEINGDLEIGSWSNIIDDLSPLSNIQSINGGLSIYGTSLTHFNSLSNLTAVKGEWLSISDNNLLEDVSGLSNVNLNNLNPIDMEYDGLYVGYNPLLSVCNIPNFCDYLSNDPATHPRIIELNAEGCEDNDAIAAACLEPFPCLAPVSLTALATFENATISWESMGTSFDIEWGFTDFTQGEGLGFQNNVSELNYTITGLSIETSYDVYVRRNCVDTSSASNWVKYTFSTVSVCPSGDLTLSSQEAINAFGAMYPNCTQIQGNLQIGSMESQNAITDLSPLSNIQSIQGGLIISGTSLTHLNGLSNLTVVNGGMVGIGANSLLEDISGLSNVSLNPIAMQSNGLFIVNNSLLSVCNIPNFCEYLSNLENPRSISGNDGDCETSDDVLNKCFAGNCESYTIWNGTSWSNGIPDNTKRVIVRNDLTISSDMTACELLLQAGIVNVNTGAAFTVEGEIYNTQSAANFIVESDANLIQLDDVENIGAITVKRNSFPLYRQDYTLWSSPVAGQNLRAFSPATLFNRFSSYDTSLGVNGDYVQEIFTTADMDTKNFIDAKGYMIRMPNNWPVFVNEATPGTVYPGVFKGTPHNGNIAIPLSSANTGLNLVGNPYPSNISIESLFDANPDIQRVLYFWRKRNDVAGSGYATYTSLGLTSLDPEIDGLDLQNTIKPGQGFFVQANSATSLHFDNQMRTSGQNGHFLRNGNTIEKHRFWLNLSMNNQVLGQTLIGYVSGATLGVDNGIDAAYFNDSALALTSLIDDEEYVIQGRSLPFADSDVVPLGFKSDVAGNFTISLSNFDGLFTDDQLIYLKDKATGMLHDLKMADYSFTSATGVFNDRFEVQYSSALGTNNPVVGHNAILIGVKNQNIQINAGSIVMEEVQLIDMMGRIIYTQGAINATSVLLENILSSNQVLIVRISTKENGIVTQKIIF